MEVVLQFGNEFPMQKTTLSQLNHHEDNVIIFRALEAEAVASLLTAPAMTSSRGSAPAPEGPMSLEGNPSFASPMHPPLTDYPSRKAGAQESQMLTPPCVANDMLFPRATSSSIALNDYDQPTTPQTYPTEAHYPKHQQSQPSAASTTEEYPSTMVFRNSPSGLGSVPPEATVALSPLPSKAPGQGSSSKKTGNFSLPKFVSKCSIDSIELLELGRQKGLAMLESLSEPLHQSLLYNPDAKHWLDQISNLKAQSGQIRTVIGVVGDTGAGKSSVINALLDEENLVPTSCMRACTAVVTEISYNKDEEGPNKYRAEVEFIKHEDWAKEFGALCHDLLDQGGNVSKESQQQDSEAGIAYAKIKAVYPNKTKDEFALIAQGGVEKLMQDGCVQNVLGTTKRIEAPDSNQLYEQLQLYVDSKENSTKQKSQKDQKETKEMEFWPLIKVVRIFIKAPALSTGAVIVDLPGVQDSNAARAAVSEGYMKQCDGYWIVAPIIRAVNNKVAHELLGKSFKRQLKYDGTYDNVTFICSKTDDISTTEACRAFGLDETMAETHSKIGQIGEQIQNAKRDLNRCKKAQQNFTLKFEGIEDDIDSWETRQADFEDGKVVYTDPVKDKKRKWRLGSSKSSPSVSKKLKADESSSFELNDEENNKCLEREPSSSEGEGHELGSPLEKTQIEDKLRELKEMKKEARKQRQEINKQMAQARQKVKELEGEKFKYESKLRAACIAERNHHSRGAIQLDFAAGIKELDQGNAEEEDPANFDSSQDLRDYDKVAQSLPVFCVSSRAYQKLSGRFQKEPDFAGFTEVDQTEIPLLQAHCITLTKPQRANGCRLFLNNFNQFITSLSLWVSGDTNATNLSGVERNEYEEKFSKRVQGLEKLLQQNVDKCTRFIEHIVSENIYGQFDAAIDDAVQNAMPTAESWGQKPDSGGLPWSTYKAVCRRNGVFTNFRGTHDWNDQL